MFRKLRFLLFAGALGGIVLVFASQWKQLADRPLWLDELHTSWVIANGWSGALPRANISNQGPLYFLSVSVVTSKTEPTKQSLRLLSGIAHGIAILCIGLIVVRWFRSPLLGLVVAWMYAFHDWQLWYAAEARCYSLVALLSIVQIALLVELISSGATEQSRGVRWSIGLVWVLLAIVLFYIHYTTIVLTFAQLAFFAGLCVKWPERVNDYTFRFRTLLLTGLFVALLPGIWHASSITGRNYDWQLISDVRQFIGFQISAGVTLLGLPVLLLVACWLVEPTRTAILDVRLVILFVGSLIPGLMIMALESGSILHLAHPRFAIGSLAITFLLSAGLLAKIPHDRLRMLGILATIVLFSVTNSGPLSPVRQVGSNLEIPMGRTGTIQVEDWESMAFEIRQRLAHQIKPVFVFPNLVEDSYYSRYPSAALDDYYRFPLAGIYNFSRLGDVPLAGRSLESKLPFRAEDLLAMASFSGGICLVRGDKATLQYLLSKCERQFNDGNVALKIDPNILQQGVLHLFELEFRE
ncbi:MAG TPA: hypothetical protein PKD64_04230 [Pirellulaceae bacterium]|nr:hypothetical protein [Pirellulaceae bacterium]HMO91380.1 hypothetical protein [Pirellulaceae bacterium]HMP69605.1 hypothetical protein [Pirellulaceae bacterium]